MPRPPALILGICLVASQVAPALAAPTPGIESNAASVADGRLYGGTFSDIWDSRFRDDIVWLADQEITTGCDTNRFCPNGRVTRGQMATFLTRGLDLPSTRRDYFTDDRRSKHEPSINRLAASRITAGCGPSAFCPDGVVTRAQMAAFLTRALDLPATTRDYFADDARSRHQDAINRLAASGITAGCGPARFCPNGAVTRGQMAAFLRRALEPHERRSAPVSTPSAPATAGSILVSRSELMKLRTSGTAWNALVAQAKAFSGLTLADQDDQGDVRLLAWALVTVRTGGDVGPIHAALARVPGTERGGRTLALGRNLAAVVLAADLVGYREASFVRWVRDVRRATLDGRTLISTHEERPNNWGTHAGASRIAADLYLGDTKDLARAAAVFRGWLGERGSYAGFNYGDLDWQARSSAPVGINPVGATRNGHSIDGVLADDQRRSGGFVWPPPRENYVYEALQGALLQAELLHRAGFRAYEWGDRALARAYRWLHTQAHFPAEGDDSWQPHLVNARYGTSYPEPLPTRPGKGFGFTDWLTGR